MSRTKKGSKGPGYEYWSRRPAKGCVDPGKKNKTITHRLERAAAKRQLRGNRRHEELSSIDSGPTLPPCRPL